MLKHSSDEPPQTKPSPHRLRLQVLKQVLQSLRIASPTLTRSTDYRTLLALLPESSPLRSEINRTLRNLEPRIENRRKEEMGEMMGKLKDLGNTFLGSPHNKSFQDEM